MIYYLTPTDNGDGSLGIEFFESPEALDFAEEHWPETYRGEGGYRLCASLYDDVRVTTVSELRERVQEELEDGWR